MKGRVITLCLAVLMTVSTAFLGSAAFASEESKLVSVISESAHWSSSLLL